MYTGFPATGEFHAFDIATPKEDGPASREDMSASTIISSGLTSVVIRSCFAAFVAGCAATEIIDPTQEAISPDAGVIAFSIDTSRLTKDESWIRPLGLEVEYGKDSVEVSVEGGDSRIHRFLLELPAQVFMFSEFEVESGAGIFWSRYRTGYSQPWRLAHGEITYLGRIEIEDVLISEEKEGPLFRPYAVKLVFTDKLEDDLPAWREHYELFRNSPPVRKAVTNWTGQDYLELWIKRSYGTMLDSFIKRARDGGEEPAVRGPAPEAVPN
jgi:hypothetical protein